MLLACLICYSDCLIVVYRKLWLQFKLETRISVLQGVSKMFFSIGGFRNGIWGDQHMLSIFYLFELSLELIWPLEAFLELIFCSGQSFCKKNIQFLRLPSFQVLWLEFNLSSHYQLMNITEQSLLTGIVVSFWFSSRWFCQMLSVHHILEHVISASTYVTHRMSLTLLMDSSLLRVVLFVMRSSHRKANKVIFRPFINWSWVII